MAEIQKMSITHEAILDAFTYDPLTGVLVWRVGNMRGKRTGYEDPSTKGYRRIYWGGAHYLEHVIIWVYMTGTFPAKQIDHKDRCKTNNAWKNLREVSASQNNFNRGKLKNNKTGVVGVSWNKHKGKWDATWGRYKLGAFEHFEEAVAARAKAEIPLRVSVEV